MRLAAPSHDAVLAPSLSGGRKSRIALHLSCPPRLKRWRVVGRRATRALVLLSGVASLLSVSGCLYATHDVLVDYSFHGNVTELVHSPTTSLQLGQFEDVRGESNPRMLVHIHDGYQQPTAGGWQAEKPVADIVRDAVRQGLVAANAPLRESGASVELTGEVQEYTYRIEKQFWTGDLFPMLTVAFRMRDVDSRQTIWKKTITGTSHFHGSFMPSTELVFRGALDDLVLRVVSDPAFANALNGQASKQ